jgi:hypothetical protein
MKPPAVFLCLIAEQALRAADSLVPVLQSFVEKMAHLASSRWSRIAMA